MIGQPLRRLVGGADGVKKSGHNYVRFHFSAFHLSFDVFLIFYLSGNDEEGFVRWLINEFRLKQIWNYLILFDDCKNREV